MPDIGALPMKIRSGEDAIREASAHFVTLTYNFPHEAVACIVPLFRAAELLLRAFMPEGPDDAPSAKLIDKCEIWDSRSRDAIHWLRNKRNKIAHVGEVPWEEFGIVQANLAKSFPPIGQLCEALGKPIRAHFRPLDAALLLGIPTPWYALAESLAESAIEYAANDPEIAVDLANAAFDTALRGFAYSWHVDGAEALSVAQLLTAMWDHPDENAHPHYWDERIYDGRDRYRDLGDAPETTLSPPLLLAEIPSIGRRGGSLAQNATYYAQEIREIVTSYLERFPLLDFEACLKCNWNALVDAMRRIAPHVIAPRTTDAAWGSYTHFFDLTISIPIPGGTEPLGVTHVRPSDIWPDEHLPAFISLLEERCGHLPLGLSF